MISDRKELYYNKRMGLDMYIEKTKKTAHTIKVLAVLNEDPKPGDPEIAQFEPLHKVFSDYYSIFEDVAYWRKFNALHKWFVDNVQGGVDECDTYEIHKNTLESSLSVLKETFTTKDSNKLPPCSGFFFGSTQADEGYWYDVEKSIEIISELIEETDWNNERLFYRASW